MNAAVADDAVAWGVASRLFNAPVALHLPGLVGGERDAAPTVGHVLRCLGLAGAAEPEPEPEALAERAEEARPARAYEVLERVAVIPVMGLLVQRLGSRWSYGWVTGYDGIRFNTAQALADPEVDAIAYHISSPGGEVAGLFDLVDGIHAARGRGKPIHAILNESAYSAAYAIASACDRITVPRTGGVGSIGVIALHADFSRMLDEAGVTVTILQHGARKSDGNPYRPLSAGARARFQADIDAMGELFVDTVARNRGLAPAAVRRTEAGWFRGEEGVRLGLADAVMAPDAAFADLVARLG